jgi:hypothetical protein
MKYIRVFLWLSFMGLGILQLHAQSSCRKIYYLNNPDFLKETQELRKQQQYDEIITLIEQKMTDSVELWHYYQLACLLALKGDTITPFEYIHKHIDLNEFAKDILTDTDLETLHATRQWRELKDSIIAVYLAQYPNSTHKELSVQLWLFGIEDQRFRTLSRNYKKQTTSQSPFTNVIPKEEKERIAFVANLLKKKVFPTYSMVGEEANHAAILIIKHSSQKKLVSRMLPLAELAVKQQETNASYYATILDFSLCQHGKKQIYGTQIWSMVKKDSNGVYHRASDYFFPAIEDEKNVNIRRKEIGLGTIEEYIAGRGERYVYNPENDKLSFKQIRKRDHKKAWQQWEGYK